MRGRGWGRPVGWCGPAWCSSGRSRAGRWSGAAGSLGSRFPAGGELEGGGPAGGCTGRCAGGGWLEGDGAGGVDDDEFEDDRCVQCLTCSCGVLGGGTDPHGWIQCRTSAGGDFGGSVLAECDRGIVRRARTGGVLGVRGDRDGWVECRARTGGGLGLGDRSGENGRVVGGASAGGVLGGG